MIVDPVTWWVSEVAGVAPVGHALRSQLSSRWTRFHSLPNSKRYADDDSDAREILKRHLTIAGELFSEGEEIYIYRCRLEENKLKGKHRHQIAGRQLRETMVRLPVGRADSDGDNDHYCVRALVTSWIPDFFATLTAQVAEWKVAGITFVSPATKNIYSPYDGGMDVFPCSMSTRALEDKYKSWMSRREDKL